MPNYAPLGRTILSLAAVFSLSACATVDVTGYGTSPAIVKPADKAVSGNIITRSVKRLYDVFIDRGFYEDSSRKRVQSAANILLNGLQTSDSGVQTISETAPVTTAALLDDVQTARYHIEQTTKAAEVYLEVASGDAKLVDELKQLQKALRVSEKAVDGFTVSDLAENHEVKTELTELRREINKLRNVTDDFGDVVRARRIASASTASS